MVDDDTPVQVSDYSKEALALKSGAIPAQGARWQKYVNAGEASGLEVRTGPKLKPIRDDVAATLNDSKKPSIPTYERWILRGLNDPAHAFPYFDKRGLATKLDQRVRHLLERETYRLKPCDRGPEEHTTEPQSLMRNSYTVFCLNKTKNEEKHSLSAE